MRCITAKIDREVFALDEAEFAEVLRSLRRKSEDFADRQTRRRGDRSAPVAAPAQRTAMRHSRPRSVINSRRLIVSPVPRRYCASKASIFSPCAGNRWRGPNSLATRPGASPPTSPSCRGCCAGRQQLLRYTHDVRAVVGLCSNCGRIAGTRPMTQSDRVETLRGITAPGILRLVVTLRAKKRKNSSSAQRYNQIRFSFHTA